MHTCSELDEFVKSEQADIERNKITKLTMNQQTNQNIVEQSISMPSYKEMLEEVGNQLKLRRSLLIRRTLFVIWPWILFVVSLLLSYGLEQAGTITVETSKLYMLLSLLVLGSFALIYTAIARAIFSIEKHIWLDSYFDGKNLDQKASWRIAKKLFWPIFCLKLRLLWKFYLLPMTIYVVAVGFVGYAAYSLPLEERGWPVLIFVIILFGGPIPIWFYNRFYLGFKTKFARFLFLDSYKHNFSYKDFFEELEKLNNINKKEMFKKTLLTYFGADSLHTISQITISSIQKGINRLGRVGKVTGALTKPVLDELSRQAVHFGEIAAIYLLYRLARLSLHQKEQEVNNYIYNLDR